MFVGPVFTREVVTVPRRSRLFIARAAYAAALLVLMGTGWQLVTGTQLVVNVGDLARFGSLMFQILAPLQLTVAVFFSALTSASAVAQEKDRRTLVLLLLTRLSNGELVLGRLLASLLGVLLVVAAGFPVFMVLVLLGGVAFSQVFQVFAVSVASAVVAGSLGSTLGLWKEKTFQTLAITTLALVTWIAWWEAVALGVAGDTWFNISCKTWAAAFSPWQAILEATRPYASRSGVGDTFLGSPVNAFILVAAAGTVLANGLAILRIRVWNPSREVERRPAEATEHGSLADAIAPPSDVAEGLEIADPAPSGISGVVAEKRRQASPHAAPERPFKTRHVWSNPILWREMRTWAYGRKMLVIRLAYMALFVAAALALYAQVQSAGRPSLENIALILAPLFVLSQVLVNAQAVTSLTSERDVRALDLLLVTDLTPKEIVFGKLGGVFYNTKEMILLPMAAGAYLTVAGTLGFENLLYLWGSLLVMNVFVAMLGLHVGMTYGNSRSAITVSLGTVFFLFVGVAVCMRIMVAFSNSFNVQLAPFLAFAFGGSVGLYVLLGIRNPSPAIALAAFSCPFATFYAITSFLLPAPLAVFLVLAGAYGFTTIAMMIPAIFEFDVATGGPSENNE